MRVLAFVLATLAIGQAAHAEGLECRRVADPTPRLSCVETPTTAQAPAPGRTDVWTPSEPRQPTRDGDGATSRNSRVR
ncbi:hypothetical protein [Bradyrhizobium sp. STM 3809]|uniref:hypothetical protein n=1 Tax=Bradyrhizobium sp. STM 3809 TaxID=551936 RepID=UPI0002408717|nr:hypothetical protein [Bradyrhizobium sp. STM 3809]CCD98991.1 exported hypothetical protein [Bradyrhizobium sp. STM 3809]